MSKRIVAMSLVITLFFGISSVAFAAKGDYPPDSSTVSSLPYYCGADIAEYVYTQACFRAPSSGKVTTYFSGSVNDNPPEGYNRSQPEIQLYRVTGSSISYRTNYYLSSGSRWNREGVTWSNLAAGATYCFKILNHPEKYSNRITFDFEIRAS